MLYVADRNGVLTALDAADGATRWTYETGSDIRATPAQGPDGMLYVGTEDERVLAIAPGGTLRWYAVLRGAVRAPPVVAADGTLYVATMSGRLYAFVKSF
jgi:outer membrane protein assembly factor BamB